MIGRKHSESVEERVEPKAFDDFELRLGDIMRGERATMGKSLLDVQRELRIKASYIAAIEDCDPDAFDTPGFIAGYVRSYARYLGMDADEVFDSFCKESGFAVAHGMSAEASVIKKSKGDQKRPRPAAEGDIFSRPGTPFVPAKDSFWSRIEPAAVGSSLILLALISGIGYGGYAVLQEVQRVQFTPAEQTPVVLSDLDPLEGVLASTGTASASDTTTLPATSDTPRAEALDRLYRPDALDVPVLVARDAPISTLDPRNIGNFVPLSAPEPSALPDSLVMETELAEAAPVVKKPVPIVTKEPGPALRMVAVRPSWVRVSTSDGTVILETIMAPGETWDAPVGEEPHILRTGESGAIYFALNGEYYGPVGETGTITSNLTLAVDSLKATYDVADLSADEALATTIVQLQTPDNAASE
ncbi:MAG: RodZ domain-containing protein [Pseudomonadota bacterium]